jgi:polyferredoxin
MLLLERFFPGLGAAEIFPVAWYGSFAAGLLADARRARKARVRLWLVFACVFFAQFVLGLCGVGQMLLTGRLHVPVPAFILYGPLFRGEMNVMPFIVLASTLLAGSAWCSMLCYFGPFDALASQRRELRPLPPFLKGMMRWGRPAVLATGIALALVLGRSGMDTGTAIALAAAYAALSLLFMAAVSRRWGGMLHCGTFCPMGMLVSLLSRLSPWRLRVDSTLCDDCGACEKLCRWRAITPESRAQGRTLMRCTLCRDCVGACRKHALSVRCAGLPATLSEKLFCGVLASLHAIFLAAAMA